MRRLLYTTLLAVVSVYTTGCAGSAIDRNFRLRVDHVTFSEGVQWGPANVGISQTVYYRLPAPLKK